MASIGSTPGRYRAGLNNQRLALLGLVVAALEGGHELLLPAQLTDLNALEKRRSLRAPFEAVFDAPAVLAFLAAEGVPARIGDDPPDIALDWKECFAGGGAYHGNPADGRLRDGFLRAFRAAADIRDTAAAIVALLPPGTAAVQLRIEHDYIGGMIARQATKPRFFLADAPSIFRRIVATEPFRGRRDFYLCCDESALPEPPERIRAALAAEFGVRVTFKSEIAGKVSLPPGSIRNAALDFEIALALPAYVGLQGSTFSGLLQTTAMALGDPDPSHFLYDTPGPALIRRPLPVRPPAEMASE